MSKNSETRLKNRLLEYACGSIDCFAYGGYDVRKQLYTAPEGKHRKVQRYMWYLYQKDRYIGKCFRKDTQAMEWIDSKDQYYSVFIMANKRGVLGWTLMKFDGRCYWTPSNKWYSSYNVAKKMRDRLNEQLNTK